MENTNKTKQAGRQMDHTVKNARDHDTDQKKKSHRA